MDAFEDLEVWKRSSALAVEVYRALKGCRERHLREQITRSAISVPSNIAEGFERNSNKQFAQFLLIAKGSCGELRTQLHLCQKMGLLSDQTAFKLGNEAVEISRMLQGLINHCRRVAGT
ncbi:MAG: four helix bundle protein [Gammaproteobacteria bacterium]|nr:four helix bundle protein [Gammaproteobacteria bacterium]